MAGAGKHHAGAVIALEADGAFDRAGGVDDVAGLDAVVFHTGRVGPTIGFGEVVMASLDRAKCACVVDAEHGGARQDKRPPAASISRAQMVRRSLRPALPVKALTLPERRTAHAVAFLADHHRLPGLRQRQRRRQARDTAADDQRVGVGVNLVVVVGVSGQGRAAQTGGATDDGLIEPVPRLQAPERRRSCNRNRRAGSG